MSIQERYQKIFDSESKVDEKIDQIMFLTEIRLSKLADKKGKVKYQDIFREISDARIAVKQLYN